MTAIDLTLPPPSEGSAEAAERVAVARQMQMSRYQEAGRPMREGQRAVNADCTGADLEFFAEPDQAGQALLAQAATKLHLSARGYHRVLKVARTIADLDGATAVCRPHIAEALSYRRRLPSETHQPPGKRSIDSSSEVPQR